MDQLKAALASRVTAARAALAAARAAGDDYLAVVLQGELESLARLAGEHDITLPDDPATPDAGTADTAEHVVSLADLEPRRIA